MLQRALIAKFQFGTTVMIARGDRNLVLAVSRYFLQTRQATRRIDDEVAAHSPTLALDE